MTFSGDRVTSLQFSSYKPRGTDPACDNKYRFCKNFYALAPLEGTRYGLRCFGFHDYTVVYPVPNKLAFTRKLIIRTFGLYIQV